LILVFGIRGLIGRSIFNYLKDINYPTIGTSHIQKYTDGSSVFHFDLSIPKFEFLKSKSYQISHAIICGGETNIDKCATDKTQSTLINVTNTIKLIQQLIEFKITPIVLSSDAVFNGEKGNYNEDSPYSSQTIYGKQKIEVENYLRKHNSRSWMVLRMSKVFDVHYQDGTLLTNWLDSLLLNNEIKCAYDQYISPTYVSDICFVIVNLINSDKNGIYNVCSPIRITRFDLAKLLAKYMELNSNLLRKCSILNMNFIEPRNLNCTLNANKIAYELGFKFSPIEKCLGLIHENYKSQGAFK